MDELELDVQEQLLSGDDWGPYCHEDDWQGQREHEAPEWGDRCYPGNSSVCWTEASVHHCSSRWKVEFAMQQVFAFIQEARAKLNQWTMGLWHGRMNYKDTKPYMSAFLSVDLLTDFAAFCLTDFIDWRYTHSWFVFSTQLVNCCPPMHEGTILVYCCPSTVPSTMCDCGEGGVLKCTVDPYSAGILHSVSHQIRNLQNCFITPNKMTSEDDN